jgi:ATPase family associated with various cellular activities (AAA)
MPATGRTAACRIQGLKLGAPLGITQLETDGPPTHQPEIDVGLPRGPLASASAIGESSSGSPKDARDFQGVHHGVEFGRSGLKAGRDPLPDRKYTFERILSRTNLRGMPMPALVENVKSLIVSHKGHDESAFRRSAEAIIRELSMQNRPGEARLIRDALGTVNGNGHTPAGSAEMSIIAKPANGLVSLRKVHNQPSLVFSTTTEAALHRVLLENREAAKLAEAGLRPESRLLFWGPPGCGKTAAAAWLAAELDLPLGVVSVGALITSYVGETGANLQRVLTAAEQTPMVLLIDEADAVAKSRDDSQDVGELRRIVNALLQGLDSFNSRRSIIIFASNHAHVFDAAVWRRFDEVVSFPLPTTPERLRLLKLLTSGLSLAGNLPGVARQLDFASYADIERAVQAVAKNSVLLAQKTVLAEDIVNEAKKWRSKLTAANKKAPTNKPCQK